MHRLLPMLLLSVALLRLQIAAVAGGDQVFPGASPAELRSLAVPLSRTKAERASWQQELAPILSRLRPGNEEQTYVLKDGSAVLQGDLFGTGTCFAFLEIPPFPKDAPEEKQASQMLVERVGSRWQIRGLWRMPVQWRPKGWEADPDNPDDYLPFKPTDRPFRTFPSVGGGPPGVTVAGDVEKYFQVYYLLRFRTRTHSLDFVAKAVGEPEVAGSGVRLHFNSGHRAISQEWQFLHWSDGELLRKTTWRDEVAYPTDREFWTAEVLENQRRDDSLPNQACGKRPR